jgi:hypothetical protein
MPRKKRSKRSTTVSEKTRAEDERLRQVLAHADPEKFKRILKPLFGARTWQAKSEKSLPSKD